MNKNIMELLNSRKLVINQYIIKSSVDHKLSLNEFLVLVYFDNDINKIFDIDSICKTLCLSSDDVMEAFNGLMIKGLAQLESIKDKDLKMITEKVSINHVYEEITLDIQKSSEVEVEDDVYKKFEHELGRPMSSMELEIINGWISRGIKEEMIVGALKEAVYNGVTRFNYIDKIIFEWDSKGFKTMDDVKKHQELRRKEKSKDKVISKKEQAILDFDWLGE